MLATDRSDWYQHARTALAEAGYRRGGARLAVLQLLDEQPCALSALEIEAALKRGAAGQRAASRASIYRVLDELLALDLVTRLEVGQGTVRYEAQRGGHAHHHHLVCDSCGTLTPFTDARLEQTIRDVAARVPIHVTEHEIILHGACRECEG